MGITMMCLIFLPAFVYVLNGTLYIDPKVLIPFMPICLLLVGRMFEQISEKSFSWKLTLPLSALLCAAFVFMSSSLSLVKHIMLADAWQSCDCGRCICVAKKSSLQTGAMAAAVIAGFLPI